MECTQGCVDLLEGWDESGLHVRVVLDEALDRTEERLSLVDAVGTDASPDLTVDSGRVGLQPHSGNDGELVAAASESPPEVGVRGAVSVGDGAVGEDDFEVVDVVTGKSLSTRQICHRVSRVDDLRIGQSSRTGHHRT